MKTKWLLFISVVFFTVMTSCKKEDDVIIYTHDRKWVQKSVAVVAPLDDAIMKTRLERTAKWFADNFSKAQMYDTLCIDLQIQWYDQNSENIASLGERLAKDTSIIAVIGPFSNDMAADFAPYCQKTLMPLILPTVTSEEVVRRFAPPTDNGNIGQKPFLWALTACDTDICETVMSYYASFCQYWSMILTEPTADVFLPEGLYGKSFSDWLPFYAENLGTNISGNFQYSSIEELRKAMKDYLTSESDGNTSFCVVENAEQMYQAALMRRQSIISIMGPGGQSDPFDEENDDKWDTFEQYKRTYFVYNGLCEEYIENAGRESFEILQGYQGFSPYADPSTGFELSYEKRFGTLPTFEECKFYDALLLSGFCAFYMEHYGEADFNQAIIRLTDNDNSVMSSPEWDVSVMEMYLKSMEEGVFYGLIGASGAIHFDKENYTVNTITAYVHWQISGGGILHKTYFGGGSRHATDATAAWKYFYDEGKALENFDVMNGSEASIKYPDLKDKYAVLVHGSTGFTNYRHLADVLSVYKELKDNGFDDDHIVLIADKSIAFDKKNPELGVIRARIGGDNLLQDVVIDYDASEITVQNIAKIMMSDIPQSENNNVLFYWSGHGRKGEFEWRDRKAGEGFSAEMLRQIVEKLTYRKMLIIAEPCYSESVIKSVEGIRGVLAISGAAHNEQSWADNWNADGLFWMSDRFTQNLLTCLADRGNKVDYKELYLYCTKHTLGSHVKIINAQNFGSLYKETPEDFFTNL